MLYRCVIGSNSSAQCEYHMLAIFARRVPIHFIVFGALVGVVMLFNCLYSLFVNRRQIAKEASTRLTTLRPLTPHKQVLVQQPRPAGQPQGQPGDENRPLLTTAAQQQQQQQQQQLLHP